MDAVGMYNNIDTDHGLAKIREYLDILQELDPDDTPIDFLLASLKEIMSNNIFQFGDTYWRQILGCAMGTSTAVNYSYLYVGSLEIQILLQKYGGHLLYFKRFVDDIIGIWLPSTYHPNAWESFLQDINNYGKLKWTTTGFTNELIFMDLRIQVLANNKLHFTTYQKELNLYLYIPPGSAHPSNMLRGLVYGRLRAYYIQNSETSDFLHYATLLAKRLMARGWPSHTLVPVFRAAWVHLQKHDKQSILEGSSQKKPKPRGKQLFFHLPYHPRGIQRSTIQQLYSRYMRTVLPDCSLTVAVSRPRNLGDRVCSATLPNKPGDNPSDHL